MKRGFHLTICTDTKLRESSNTHMRHTKAITFPYRAEVKPLTLVLISSSDIFSVVISRRKNRADEVEMGR